MMKSILFFVLLFLTLSNSYSQETEQPQYIQICQQAERIYMTDGAAKVLKFLEEKKHFFNECDDAERFIWHYATALYAYSDKLYKRALPHLDECIKLLDNEGDSFYVKDNAPFLRVYYWYAISQFYNKYDKSIVEQNIEKAKKIYETASLQDNEVYTAILNDLKYLRTNLDQEILMGLKYAIEGRDNDVINFFNAFIKKLNLNDRQHMVYHAQSIQMTGNALINVGKIQQAQLLYIDEIKALEKAGLTSIESYRNICDALSVVNMQLHNYEEGYKWGMKAKISFEKNQIYDYAYYRCLANLALNIYYLGNNVWAKILIDVVLKNIERVSLLDTNSIYDIFSQHKLAADDIRSQYDLNIYKNLLATLYSNASIIYESVGCKKEAVSVLKRSVEISELFKLKTIYPLNSLGYYYCNASQYKKAAETFKKAESYAQTDYEKNEIGLNLALAQKLSSMKEAIITAEKYSEEIKKYMQNSFMLLTKKERDKYWQFYKYNLHTFNWIMSEDSTKSGNIYNNVLLSKGMLLRSFNNLTNAIKLSPNTAIHKKYLYLQTLRERVNNSKDINVVSVLQDTIESINREITNELKLQQKPVTWEMIRESLKDNEVAIELTNIPTPLKVDSAHTIKSEARYCALVIRKSFKKPRLISLCLEKQFESVTDSSYYTTDDLYKLFWEPLTESIEDATTIYYSPEGYISDVALENVLNLRGRRISQEQQIVRVSSTSEILRNDKLNKGKESILIGGISYAMDKSDYVNQIGMNLDKRSHRNLSTRGSLDDISVETYNEVKNISTLLKSKGYKTTVLTETRANESNFKSLSGKNINLLHIATHGFYWSDENDKTNVIQKHIKNPFISIKEHEGVSRSGLLLAGAKLTLDDEKLPESIDDGILTGSEIENMDLSAVDLVVLSACQTGLGLVDTIEGVYGLQRAFKKAGVKSLMMTLWKVDDEASQIFMTEFYRDLVVSNSKLHALKKAQEYLKTFVSEDGDHPYSDPYYWAGFILLDALN